MRVAWVQAEGERTEVKRYGAGVEAFRWDGSCTLKSSD